MSKRPNVSDFKSISVFKLSFSIYLSNSQYCFSAASDKDFGDIDFSVSSVADQ